MDKMLIPAIFIAIIVYFAFHQLPYMTSQAKEVKTFQVFGSK